MKTIEKGLWPRVPAGQYRILFTRADASPERVLVSRVLIVVLLVALVVAIMWWDRAGLRDHIDGHVSFADVVYFTMVTITTVGYGDIVPVSERARLIDGLFITPVRLFIFFIFLGTAYQFVVQKLFEEYRMSRLQRRLKGHFIICGYGHTGRVAARELAAKGYPKDQIIIIDSAQHVLQEAADDGFAALRGDATREAILIKAGIHKAEAVIVTPGRDDTNILIVLTVRQLNPEVRIVSGVKEAENVKLVKQGGANVIVSPSKVGGYMLADAIDRAYTVDYLYDLMTAGGDMNLIERPARADEVGKMARAVADGLVLGVHRAGEKINFWDLQQTPLRDGDILLVITRPDDGARA